MSQNNAQGKVRITDSSGNSLSSTNNGLDVVIVPGTVVNQIGQKAITTTGVAVQLSTSDYVLQVNVIISASLSNNYSGVTVGLTSALSNVVDGTGNGFIIFPGGSTSLPAGVNINNVYINGTAGDVVSFIGN